MKKVLTIVCAVVFICSVCIPSYAQLALWRSAATLKQGQYIVMTQFYYMDFAKTFDTAEEEWKDYNDSKTECGFQSMIGYGVTDRMEALIHIPFRSISYESANGSVKKDAMGVGDIWLKTRIAILPWSKDRHGLTFLSTLSLPTGAVKTENSLGSGKIGYAMGGIFSTKWMHDFRGHIKMNYWFNQKGYYYKVSKVVEDYVLHSKDFGDTFEMILKLDRNFNKKLMGFCCFVHTKKWKDRTAPGVVTAWSHKTRYILQPGVVYKPIPGLFIRPKIAFAIGGEVGTNYTLKPMVDVWYVFSPSKG